MSDLHNPYAPPKSDLGLIPPDADSLVDAPTGKRFLNLILDYIGVIILMIAFVLVGALVSGSGSHASDALSSQFVGFGAMIGYYLFFEGLFGRTPGKFLTGTRVVARDGGRPRFGQVVGRTFARFVPFEPFSFLARSPTGWHDDWSRTRVVLVR